MITLLSDFGLKDHFVGTMKGVIARIAPQATVVDITHEIPAFEVAAGAFLLEQAWPYFQRGTVHVAIVDPGVGTSRRPILIESEGHYFVGPDNGLFSLVLKNEKAKVWVLDRKKYWLPEQSSTFHGRDIFSPVAAHLETGVKPRTLGTKITDPWRNPELEPVRQSRRSYVGVVMHVDRFGNLITNFRVSQFSTLRNRPFVMKAGLETVEMFASTYDHAVPGELSLIAASTGYYEIAISQDSAAKRLGLEAGSPIELTVS